MLLGVAPSLVERPSTPAALSVTLLSTLATGDNALPAHYALELAPYWLAAHRSLSRQAYEHPHVGQSILQTFSVSVATSKPPKKVAADAVDVGVGIRFALLAGHVNARFDDLAARLSALQLEYQVLDAIASRLPRRPSPSPALPPEVEALFDQLQADPSMVRVEGLSAAAQQRAIAAARRELVDAWTMPEDPGHAALDAVRATLEQRMQSAARRLSTEDLRRRGWMVTVAGAAAARVPAGTETGVAASRLMRWGLWATPAYRFDTPAIDLVSVARLTVDRSTGARLVDVGGRLAQQVGHLTWAGELLQRFAPVSGAWPAQSQRAALTVDYRFTRGLVLTSAIGKDFAAPLSPDTRGGLLSQLGLTIGFGNAPVVELLP